MGYSPNLVGGQTYTLTRISDLTDLGVTTSESVYKLAQAAFSQNPRPPTIKVATIGTPYSQSVELTALSAAEGAHVKVTLVSPTGVETEIDYTIPGSATTTTVATAVAALIDAVTGLTAASAVAVITSDTDTAGTLWGYKDTFYQR
jgi:hypothetical protein